MGAAGQLGPIPSPKCPRQPLGQLDCEGCKLFSRERHASYSWCLGPDPGPISPVEPDHGRDAWAALRWGVGSSGDYEGGLGVHSAPWRTPVGRRATVLLCASLLTHELCLCPLCELVGFCSTTNPGPLLRLCLRLCLGSRMGMEGK